ncbi:mitochondrial small ribosomal subunit Rsm22-domain-containing protein, partial [Piptocephalis cylindrospora]
EFPGPRGSEAARMGKKRTGAVELPEPLVQAITAALQGPTTVKTVRDEVKRMAEVLSTTAGVAIQPQYQVVWGEREALAYASAYSPGAYAAVHNVLSEVRGRMDGPEPWAPRRVLDFGCGPGTATWAVENVWSDGGVEEVRGVDVSEPMLTMAQNIHRGFQDSMPDGPKTTFHRFLSYSSQPESYDLVVASYVLGDLVDDQTRVKTLRELWDRTGEVLVLIERGTPEGFRALESMRSTLLGSRTGAHILGPCPHEGTCPMAGTTKWCHFPQRVQRPPFTMQAKGGSRKNWEDRKYSYLILRRGARPGSAHPPKAEEVRLGQGGLEGGKALWDASWAWPRVIDAPMKRDGHVLLDTCVRDGHLERIIIPKSQGKVPYYDARKTRWGDLFPHAPK